MRRLAFLVASVAMLSLAPSASARPPEDRVLFLDFSDTIDCDAASITFDATGWANGPFGVDHPTNYHVKWVFSNADGETWEYNDVGNIRVFERDGVLYESLSGRSTNVGPDNSTWIGHWLHNIDADETSYAGHGLGDYFELACSMLT